MDSVTGQPSYNSTGQMFSRIAPFYDKLNHILSFGMDFFWRNRLALSIEHGKKLRVLDLATGTGDLLIAVLNKNSSITEAVGLDISEEMLEICRRKIARYNLTEKSNLICADMNSSGLSEKTFDVITIGFGIRNTPDASAALSEIFRLLRYGGTTFILEFSMPANPVIRFFYLIYLRHCVPLIGRVLSGDKNAYKYLNTSVEKFYSAKDFTFLMRKAGFEDIQTVPLTFGVARIYRGSKPVKINS